MRMNYKNIRSSLAARKASIYIPFYISVLLFGIFISEFLLNLSLKKLAFIPIALAALVFLTKDWERSIKLFFCYLSVEGLLKMVSNYHPVIHVGADILLLLIVLNWFFTTVVTGFREASFKMHITMIPLYFFAYFFINSKEQIVKYWNLFLVLCSMVCVIAVVEYMLVPKSISWMSSTYEEKLMRFQGILYRPFSTTTMAGGGAIFAHVAAPFAVSSLFLKNSISKKVFIYLLLFF